MKLKSVIVFFSIICLPFLGLGQSPPYINYKGGDKIPSSETYHVIQDSKGYIWIATACGVSRFDGYEFTTFTLKDGLPDNVIHYIYEDYMGRIWFVSYSGQLSYFYEGRIIHYKYNYLMDGLLSGGKGIVKCSFRVLKDDSIVLSVNRKGIFRIFSNGRNVKLYSKNDASLIFDFSGKTSFPILAFDFSISRTKNIIVTDSIKDITNEGILMQNPTHLYGIEKNHEYLVSLGEVFVTIKEGKVNSHRSDKPVIWISSGSDGLVWVSRYNGGLSCYKDIDIYKNEIIKLFDGLSITSVCKDREGGYWFSTYANGLFYISNLSSKTYFWHPAEANSRKILTIGRYPKGILVGFDNGDISAVNSYNTIENIPFRNCQKMDLYINYIHYNDYSKDVLFFSNIYAYSFRNGIITKFTEEFPRKGADRGIVPRCAVVDKDKTWIGTRIGLLKFENKKVIYDSFESGDFKSTVNSMAISKDGSLWLGCSDGLWKFKHGRFEWLGEAIAFFRNRISRVVINPIDSTLWVGTRGGGVGVYDGRNLVSVNSDDGLQSDVINSIAMGADRVWVGSSSGVSQVSIVPDLTGKYSVSNFDRSIGIVSNEIIDLIPSDSTLVIGTRDGILSYKLEDAWQQVKPKVLITKLTIDGVDTTINSKLDLKHFENHISIYFAGFTFKTLGNTLFRYRLHESDSTFVYTRIPYVVLPALSPDSYRFEVWAQNAYGQWSLNPARIDFTISPPFWTTPWFVFLVSVALFLILSIAFSLRLRVIKRHDMLSRRLDGWKQQALLQQMNPHFIFNTLNSIQLFILQNDALSSHRYLTKFAKLMRLTLENSQSFSVSFSAERESLDLYLELEALRADGKFVYEIVVDDNISNEITIPSLIVQPFVENAIWHGVIPKGGGGKISVVFKMSDKRILCSIEDNGIGRVEADKYASSKAHKSLGSKITMQRLQLLKSMYGQQLGIVYVDLKDSSGAPIGTKVELAIPILPSKVILD